MSVVAKRSPISATAELLFTLSFANGHIFSDGPLKVTVGIRSVLNHRFGGSRFYWIGPI